MNSDFISELSLNALIRIKENSWNGKNYVELEKLLTDDINVINYRLDAMTDLIENDVLFEAVKDILPELMTLMETKGIHSGEADEIDSLYAVRDLQIYVNLIDYLNEKINSANIKSKLFTDLKNGINEITMDESFARLKEAIPENTRLVSDVQSVTLGINLDSGLHPTEAGIVSINNQKFVSGSIIDKVLRLDSGVNPYQCSSPLSSPRNLLMNSEERKIFESVLNTALYKLVKASIRSWKPAVRAYANSKTNFILGFYSDLRFLAAGAEFFRKHSFPT